LKAVIREDTSIYSNNTFQDRMTGRSGLPPDTKKSKYQTGDIESLGSETGDIESLGSGEKKGMIQVKYR
jgi:hypothetical protein